ncbi:methyl-CpG-binding domain protein 1 isoform X2 [Eublepharis macularius]|uniref:Methyl-CpG-binding domain protein 1 isoform X2 n=1 Tax=Eublepharis macularius TaxID=481883 RepID=A0AA97LK52_EUBMA|nr:methyl-CpG-binding domain protein 1 isoform X2 [Eublepharis macularius]
MTDGWVDCPSLGPGWRRREVIRKATAATKPRQSDTYYISPRGEKIRSRVELMRLMGCSRDLTDFDFKKGVFIEPSIEPTSPFPPTGESHQKVKKSSKKRLLPLEEATPPLKKPPDLQNSEKPLDQKPPKLEPELPIETPASIPAQEPEPVAPVEEITPKPHKRRYRKHPPPILAAGKMGEATMQETVSEETLACCAVCQGQFPGVMLPSQRRCRWLCPDCRAQRRDFNREQRYYKRVGCGVCHACQISQDCGICSVCVVRAKSPELRIGIKCLLRRCLKIVKKGLECGMCQACKLTEDCGSCRICIRRQNPGMKRQWKCVKRRCLRRKKKISPKKEGFGSKKLTEEASPPKDTIAQARRRQKRPASSTDGPPPKAQRAPRRRRKRLSAAPQVATDGPPPKAQLATGCRRRRHSATTKWKLTMERDPGVIPTIWHRKNQLGTVKERKKAGRPPKHPIAKIKNSAHTSASRQNRKCGECEACLLKTDCGRCDFCRDKPKFGGRNLKRQKCRWRQCLHFAMVEEVPSVSKPLDLSKPQETQKPQISDQQPLKLKDEKELAQDCVKDHSVLPQQVKEKPQVPCHPTPPTRVLAKESDTRLPAVNLLLATSPKIKQERAEPGGDHRPLSDSPVLAGLPQSKRARGAQEREVVILDDEEDGEVEQLQPVRPPVIMEVYSLGGVQPLNPLDSVLQEFLAELNEIPLPAHWEVLPLLGSPDLRLVQRSKHSTMSAAVIHIRPGLFFHVVVRDLPVPPEHELYASHPARLTTVDEVVELICDLEAYRLCPGWPAGWHAGERSQACDVLVYSGCCPQCRLNPWPSGSGAH